MTTIQSEHSLKMIREALCVAQHGIRRDPNGEERWIKYSRIIQSLINDIDRQRPIGSNGKHGNLHTPHCQCEDK